MTHEQLIATAREHARDFSDPSAFPITLDALPKVRVLDAAVVYFESPDHDGKIEVFLEKETGRFITATLIPQKAKPSQQT
jgi:hypothetical protein